MRILNNNSNNNTSFQSARMNILAMADNHGCIGSMPRLIETVKTNKYKIFTKPKDKSTLNVFAVAGDFYLSPDNIGLRTRKTDILGDVQHDYLLKMINTFKSLFGGNLNLETVFAPGNHDLEGGSRWLLNKLKDAPMTSLFSNTKLSKSPMLTELMKTQDNLVTSVIHKIPDNKNPEIINHALFLGITIPRKKFNSKQLEGLEFYDRLDKNDSSIQNEDLLKTYRKLNKTIEEFKKQHPNGAVVLLSHMGSRVSGFISDAVKGIDLILNGHDHLKTDSLINGTFISSLGENNNFVKSLNLQFDDFGKLALIEVKKFKTEPYALQALENKDLQKFVNENAGEDLKPLVDLTEHKDLIKELKYTKDIRFSDKLFVNYVTSGIKEALHISYPVVDVVGIPSEAFRGGLASIDKNKTYFDNFDLIKMFGGINKDNSQLRIGEVTGEELLRIVIKNVIKNIEKPKENGLIHWSDIQIDRTLIEKIKNGESSANFYDAVKFRNQQTGEYEVLDNHKNYRIVMSDKALIKQAKRTFMRNLVENKFQTINETLPKLLGEYLDLQNYHLKFSDEVKEQRIL